MHKPVLVHPEVDEATETAKVSPAADPAIAELDVWADGGSAWRN